MCSVGSLHAALFEDDEARRAILELRQRVEIMRGDAEQARQVGQASAAELAGLGKSLLDLQRQIELLKADVATLRGSNEQLMRALSEIQRQQKDQMQALHDRFSKLEPVTVQLDGVEFVADQAETRDYDAALAVFRKGDFASAQSLFSRFVASYPASGYAVPALFWLGNAQYATRDYKGAMANFRALIAKDPEHLRTPEAVLSVANCQLELKDAKGARKTLTDLIKAYPKSEAAIAAKERLATLK
ncbi:MAG: tol-pal system protein YbgF [Rhodoferax sp.]|nr:tol-pal system protein YbgF [Rhodoferax sp.]MDD2920314.1 tol-pal system protein YbgF [Rhodoferax sp.]